MVRITYILVALALLTSVRADQTVFTKRQLVVGRVGFRPGRSLAIGRAAFYKPSGKRADVENESQIGASWAPRLSHVLMPNLKDGYCTPERQEIADALFSSVVQAVQELRQFAVVCYGNENPTGSQETGQNRPEDQFEYVREQV